MSFGDAIRSVFSQYATFSGRASRSEFWWFYLFTVLASVALQALDTALQSSAAVSGLGGLFGLAILLPTLAVTCRRLHDSGRTGWWMLGLLGLWIVAGIVLVAGVIGLVVQAIDDSGRGGGVALFGVLVAVGVLGLLALTVWWIVLLTRPSTPGPNQYGPHPLLPVGQPGPLPPAYGSPGQYDAPGRSPWGPPDAGRRDS